MCKRIALALIWNQDRPLLSCVALTYSLWVAGSFIRGMDNDRSYCLWLLWWLNNTHRTLTMYLMPSVFSVNRHCCTTLYLNLRCACREVSRCVGTSVWIKVLWERKEVHRYPARGRVSAQEAGAELCDARQGCLLRIAELAQHPQHPWPLSWKTVDGIQMAVRGTSLSCGDKCWEKHLMFILGCDLGFLWWIV